MKNFTPRSGSGINGSDYDWTYLFTGRESGLQLNRNRYYHNQLGRWINRDPIGYAGGDNNLYGYVAENPILNTDPDFKFFIDPGTIEPY